MTLGFSKCLRNLRSAVALYVVWYKYCRMHGTIRMTPAIVLGITDTIGDPDDLLAK